MICPECKTCAERTCDDDDGGKCDNCGLMTTDVYYYAWNRGYQQAQQDLLDELQDFFQSDVRLGIFYETLESWIENKKIQRD